MPYYNKDPKRDHNFDNHPYGFGVKGVAGLRFRVQTSVIRLEGLQLSA